MFRWSTPIRNPVSIKFMFEGENHPPEEIETKEAISDCLIYTFKDFKYWWHSPLEILVEGNYMDYNFKIVVHSKLLKSRINAVFEELNSKLASI